MKTGTAENSMQTRIADRYRRMIQLGKLREGERLPTVRQVAKDLEISITPAIGAFEILEREGIVYRRRGAGTFVGRVPTRLPRTLDIGVLFREPIFTKDFDNYGLRMFLGVQNELQSSGNRTVLATLKDHGANVAQMADQFKDQPAHGYILDEYVPDELVEWFAATNRPVVVVNRACGVKGVGTVRHDMFMAGRMAGERIKAAGHRKAGIVFYDSADARRVKQIFAEAFQGEVIAMKPSVESPKEEWERSFAKLLLGTDVTALYFLNDLNAHFFSQWAQKANMRIPEDVSVVGTFDLDLAVHMQPPLTTIRFDPREIGAEAVRELIRCCRETGRRAESHLIAGEWVERQSLRTKIEPSAA